MAGGQRWEESSSGRRAGKGGFTKYYILLQIVVFDVVVVIFTLAVFVVVVFVVIVFVVAIFFIVLFVIVVYVVVALLFLSLLSLLLYSFLLSSLLLYLLSLLSVLSLSSLSLSLFWKIQFQKVWLQEKNAVSENVTSGVKDNFDFSTDRKQSALLDALISFTGKKEGGGCWYILQKKRGCYLFIKTKFLFSCFSFDRKMKLSTLRAGGCCHHPYKTYLLHPNVPLSLILAICGGQKFTREV